MNTITQKQVNALTEAPIGKVVGQFDFVKEFHSYMFSFYGKGGLYDEDFTADEILAGTVQYIQSGREFEGDSVDREAIRDIVLANRG